MSDLDKQINELTHQLKLVKKQKTKQRAIDKKNNCENNLKIIKKAKYIGNMTKPLEAIYNILNNFNSRLQKLENK